MLVSFSRPVGIEFLELGHHLEQLLGRKVDLVSLGGIAPKYLDAIQDDLIDVQACSPSLA
ncbi:MAG: hypothetical protein ACO3CI_03685 [Schleiferiaceae bacterium]